MPRSYVSGKEEMGGKLKKYQVAADAELRVENCGCSNGPVSEAHL